MIEEMAEHIGEQDHSADEADLADADAADQARSVAPGMAWAMRAVESMVADSSVYFAAAATPPGGALTPPS